MDVLWWGVFWSKYLITEEQGSWGGVWYLRRDFRYVNILLRDEQPDERRVSQNEIVYVQKGTNADFQAPDCTEERKHLST